MASESILLRTRRRLWFHSGGVCAMPGCDELIMEATPGGEDDTNVAHECHIVAQKDDPDVARAVSSLSQKEREEFAHLIEDRHGFANLVLMCLKHSRVVDDPKQGYSVADMVKIKRDHETDTLRSRSVADKRDEHITLVYAEIVDQWAARIGLDEWEERYSSLVGDGHPRMEQEHFDALIEAGTWLFSRVWPRANQDLEDAFENLRLVAQDLQRLLQEHPHETLAERGLVAIARFYNDPRYWRGEDTDHALLDLWYEYYSALVEDMTYELTRAANLVCDVVRRTIDPRYRFEEGVVTLTAGPFMDFSFATNRPHYDIGLGVKPYPGLRAFLGDRANRDIVRGEGEPPEGLRLPGDAIFE